MRGHAYAIELRDRHRPETTPAQAVKWCQQRARRAARMELEATWGPLDGGAVLYVVVPGGLLDPFAPRTIRVREVSAAVVVHHGSEARVGVDFGPQLAADPRSSGLELDDGGALQASALHLLSRAAAPEAWSRCTAAALACAMEGGMLHRARSHQESEGPGVDLAHLVFLALEARLDAWDLEVLGALLTDRFDRPHEARTRKRIGRAVEKLARLRDPWEVALG